jgi:hypothetical protein
VKVLTVFAMSPKTEDQRHSYTSSVHLAEDVVVYFVILAALVVDLFVDELVVFAVCVVDIPFDVVETAFRVVEVFCWVVETALLFFLGAAVTV